MTDLSPGSDTPAGAKLASSAIHPAVARSRGYLYAGPGDELRTVRATRFHMPSPNWGFPRLLRMATAQAGGVMIMPWYRPGDPQTAATLQARPDQPVDVGKSGQQAKYLFPKGAEAMIDVHPALPRRWLSDTNVPLVVTEGLLKGDAFISAMINDLDPDVTDDELTSALNALPPQRRYVVATIYGATAWHGLTDWNDLPRRDRDIFIAFDADITVNRAVNREAHYLHKWITNAEGRMWVIQVPAPVGSHDGIDDYLASGGTIDDLLDHITGEVPDLVGDLHEAGKAYVVDDGLRTVLARYDAASRQVVDDPLIDVGGWVEAIEIKRVPTETEILAGAIDPTNGEKATSADRSVRLHVRYIDPDRGESDDEIIGPEKILSVSPDKWDRYPVEIPTEVSLVPEWPPPMPWLAAIKRHTEEEHPRPGVEMRSTSNGWVPGTCGLPIFVLGASVVGANDTVRLSPDRLKVPGIDRFGLNDPGQTWRQRAAECLPTVVGTMLGRGAWTDPGVALITLCAGLRPTMPLRPRTTLFYVGSRGAGKSWSASKANCFWARYPGAVNPRNAGGSASDTAYAIETAIGRMPMWVVDDLAPDSSRGAAENRESAVSAMVRAVANGASRNRMNANGTPRETMPPRALMIVTAENSLGVSSARDRVVPVTIQPGSLGPPEAVEAVSELFDTTTDPSDLTACTIRYLLHRAQDAGWDDVIDYSRKCQGGIDRRITEVLESRDLDKGAATRFREMAADLLCPAIMLRHLAKEADIADHPDLAPLFNDAALTAALEIVVGAVIERRHYTPGAQLVEAVRALLSSGKAHVVAFDGTCPVQGEGSASINSALGWSTDSAGTQRPGGSAIGYYAPDDGGRDGTVLIRTTPAFAEVRRHYPDLVPPGSKCRETFRAVWAEGLADYKGAQSGLSVVYYRNGIPRRGVPLSMRLLLGLDEEE